MPTQIDALLARLNTGAVSSPQLEHSLGASQSSISRMLRDLAAAQRVVRIGARRGARYGLRRDIEGIGSEWPVRRIDRVGRVHEMGTLYSLAANQYFFDSSKERPANGFVYGGLTDGLPYYLQDQRPGGFLGRAVPSHYPELELPQRVIDWTDTHYLRYLTRRGGDAVGDLILGDEALDTYLAGLRNRTTVGRSQRSEHYPRLADAAMHGRLPGSSAHGEHPKFVATIEEGSEYRQMIVKFSPPMNSAAGQRWANLLVAEHHAHTILRSAAIPACESSIFRFADRTYLETVRFDRQGLEGRIGVTSLLAVDSTRYGALDKWIDAAMRLHRDGALESEDLENVRLVATFGELIANTDRHFGNLAFFDRYDGNCSLAPIYDMLPMLFAPEHDQIVARAFAPPGPTSGTLAVWPRARALAEQYWETLAGDERIGEEFRKISAECLKSLEALPRTGAFSQADPALNAT